ncbi:MAG: hypothetical protein ACRC9Q_03115 [Bacteroidales bacterium]
MEQKKISVVLLILFYALTLAAVLVYFLSPDRTLFLYCGGSALAVRGMHYFMKFFM